MEVRPGKIPGGINQYPFEVDLTDSLRYLARQPRPLSSPCRLTPTALWLQARAGAVMLSSELARFHAMGTKTDQNRSWIQGHPEFGFNFKVHTPWTLLAAQ